MEVDHFPVVAFQMRRLERLNAPPFAGVPKYVGENQPVPLGLIRMRWFTTLALLATGTAAWLTVATVVGGDGAVVVGAAVVIGAGVVVGATVVVVA